MKKLSLVALILLYIILTFYYFNRPVISYAKTTNNKGNENKIDKTNEKDKTKIKIYFPVTDYPKLNKVIKYSISSYINEFSSYAKDNDISYNQYNTLYILYDEFRYENIISYVFNIEMYTGGAHPNHYIKTINYDIDNNIIIDIDYLENNNSDILEKISTRAYEILTDKLKKGDSYDDKIVKEGTSPTKNNFKNFIFTKDGLKFYFPHYQVAPYSYGSTDIIITYDEIGLSK